MKRFKKWLKKIRREYRQSKMNPINFMYATISGDISDMRIKWKNAHLSEEERLFRSIHKKLDEMIRQAECSK